MESAEFQWRVDTEKSGEILSTAPQNWPKLRYSREESFFLAKLSVFNLSAFNFSVFSSFDVLSGLARTPTINESLPFLSYGGRMSISPSSSQQLSWCLCLLSIIFMSLHHFPNRNSLNSFTFLRSFWNQLPVVSVLTPTSTCAQCSNHHFLLFKLDTNFYLHSVLEPPLPIVHPSNSSSHHILPIRENCGLTLLLLW